MDAKGNKLKIGMVTSCITMILTLMWLTISLPFVNEYTKSVKQTAGSEQTDNSNNPLPNNTEEKNESSLSSVSEEYLHDHNDHGYHYLLIEKYFKCHPSGLYYEFHPELISPPPEV